MPASGCEPLVGRPPRHASSVDTSNGAFHVKRASGEGAVPWDHHIGLSTEYTISAANEVTENDMTRWHRFVRSNHVNHRGSTSVFSATDSFVFHVKHGRRRDVRFVSGARGRNH